MVKASNLEGEWVQGHLKNDQMPKVESQTDFEKKTNKKQKTKNKTNYSASDDQKRVCSCDTPLQREHMFRNFNCPTREWASPWKEQAIEASVAKQSAAERVSGVSGASERT